MILSGTDINRNLGYGDLEVEREQSNEELRVEPSSIDLHLGETLLAPDKQAESPPVKVDNPETYPKHVPIDDFTIYPNEFLLAHTDEVVNLPDYEVGFVHGRSSVGRLGLFVHNAGLIDAGFEGQITLELYNAAPYPIELKPGMRIAQITVHEHQTPAFSSYGKQQGSKYQDQMGPTPSRLYQDFQ